MALWNHIDILQFIGLLLIINSNIIVRTQSPDNLLHCPEDWRREGIHCYRFFNIKHSWRRAAEICRRYGSELALISDYTQNNFTTYIADESLKDSTSRSYWIGFQSIDNLSTNTLESASGRFISKYVGFWASDEPNVKHGQCVRSTLHDWQLNHNDKQQTWELAQCEDLLPFICQKQTCPSGSHHCSNGKCINISWKCDGQDDCGDKSDEMDCQRKCHYYLQSSGDKVVSPNYPNRYDSNSDCKWTLEGPIGSGMVLQFSEFDTESNFDSVQILAGGRTEESSVTLATLSGHQNLTSRMFTTGSNLMIVKFRSDATVEKRGFRASWKTEPIKCGGDIFAHSSAQVITSPLYPEPYPGGLECVYIINAPQGKTITLEVVEFDLEPEKDYIYIRDGPGSKYPMLAKLTGNVTDNPRYIVSTGNKLYLYFYTSFGDSRRGFAIRFRTGCEIEYTSNAGNVTSPAFGVSNYPTNQNCVYRLLRPGGGSLSILFNAFDVANDDILQIYDGSDQNTGVSLHPNRGFGTKTKPVGLTLTASSGKMLLLFKSNALNAGRGWSAAFSSDCPTLKIGLNAVSSSRGAMFGARVTFTCPVGQEFSNGVTKLMTECMQGGQWSLSSIPNCQERYCGPVPQIDNGFAVNSTNVTYRGIATYQCYAGFAFPSSLQTETIRCGEDGKWEKLPLCLASSCPPIPETPNAIQSIMTGGANRSYGTIVRFECEPGYHRHGVPVIACTSVGQWSGMPPTCERAQCHTLPNIENGFIVDSHRKYYYNDEARVQCNRGYKLDGHQVIKCGVNQTFDSLPNCRDVDECVSSSACDLASTHCSNTNGGFFCKCKEGFDPNLNCRPVSDLGLSTSAIPDTSIKVSGVENGYKKSEIRLDSKGGWCGAVPRVGENWVQIDLRAPTVIRGFRIQSVLRMDGTQAYPITVRLQHANELTDLFRDYSDLSGRPVQFRLAPNGGSGLSIVNLPIPLESRYVRLLIMEFAVAPCMRFELMGCSRQDCIDVNECLDKNGGCDQRCVNSPGGFNCLCNVGYELYTTNGTAGYEVSNTETGIKDGDIFRINKTCVPKQCPSLKSPQNGKLLSTKTQYHFGDLVHFYCDFGYVMIGSPTLLCTSNGSWNGTIPDCNYAQCSQYSNDAAQGLKFELSDHSSDNSIPYLNNVTIDCTEEGRPMRGTASSSFRQCVYDPKESRSDFWLSGLTPSCPRIDCGSPPETNGATYGFYVDTRYRASFFFGCEETFTLGGKTDRNDNVIRCGPNGNWDFGDLRCEGPVCSDPGYPPDGQQIATSYEQGSQVSFTCNRPGFVPYSNDPITCVKNADCKIIKPLGLASGLIPDNAINSTSQRSNYEANKVRLNSATGWCGQHEPFTYVTVDLGKIYRIKVLMVKGVVTNDVVGRPTELRFFYKVRESENFVVYFPNFNLTSREPGNYGELTVIPLPVSVTARYIILGIVSYNKNPCLKFELMGCEDTKEEILLGYDNGYPVCVDQEPPHFTNCPNGPIVVTKGANGINPVNYTIPTPIDNSGFVARVEVKPLGFRPPLIVFEDTIVQYFAYDNDGNVAVCEVNITVPEDTPPALHCPQSYVVELVEKQDSYHVNFNETRRLINATDESGDVRITLNPESALIPLKGYRNVSVVASDRFGNEAFCHFQVSVQPTTCVSWALEEPANGVVNCSPNDSGNGFRCLVTCNSGFRFIDSESTKIFECVIGNQWTPGSIIPDCVPEDTNEANYDVIATLEYRSGGFAPPACMSAYVNYVSSYYSSLNQILSDRCSAINVQMAIMFFNTTITIRPDTNALSVEYVLRIDPAVRQKLLYDLCGSTLGLIFDLSVPSTSAIIEPILNISSQQVGGSCPSLQALRSNVIRGFTCQAGEILNSVNISLDKNANHVPRCLHCPAGTFASKDMQMCTLCARGWYQDSTRQASCRQCPDGTYTKDKGSKSLSDCMPVCGYGTYSPTGLVPCLQCPSNTYSGVPPKEGFKECQRCPTNTFTYSAGSTTINECKVKCPAGTYSETGLEPCAPCPTNFYQEKEGQTTCSECSSKERTLRPGALSPEACTTGLCSSITCQNGGVCILLNHEPTCYCPAGFSGQLCESDINECSSDPCYNGGTCVDSPQGYACKCPTGYSGLQCQIIRNECKNDTCPEKAMCQDLPGLGNVNCLCRSGYEGVSCNITINPCSLESSPCENSGNCIPLLQGRYRCDCPPGWTGRKCETNIDDCAEEPCLLGANCTDLVNDYKCDCPPGFTGKRCHQKIDLCSVNPCLNGICVDRLFFHECICNPGWTGVRCETNVDECASDPCENNGECVDLVDGFKCVCDTGYIGSRCQHTIDSCESKPCQNGGTCFDLIDGFMCQCRPGFVGVQCEAEVDECVSNPCHPLGTEKCIDIDNGFKCECNAGYSGELCETNVDDCSSSPCLNGGTCNDDVNGFKCKCLPGWSGHRCEADIGMCDSNPCHNDAKCVDLFQDYFCVCPSGTDGKRCQTSPQRCIGNPCQNNGICRDFGSGLNCSCPQKYTGIGCQYEYKACDENICQNGATCIDIGEGYKCKCAPGFTGKNCDQDIVDCTTTSCPPTATCIDLTNGFYCKCPFNLTGEDCRKPINIDYDLYLNDESRSSSVALAAPFDLNEATSLTLALWVQYYEESIGTYLTLYSVESPHLPIGKRPMINANHNGIYVSLFPDKMQDVFMPYLENVPINDGQWHYINLIWDGKDGTLMLVTDTAVAATISDYAIGLSLPSYGWINLGSALDDKNKAIVGTGFHGRVSRVNMWNRALDMSQEIPSQIRSCKNSPVIFNGLLLRFTGYDRVEGTVEREGPGKCGERICPTGYSGDDCRILQQDKTPPSVLHCPPDMWIISENSSTVVNWDEPQFTDDLRSVQVLELEKIRSGESLKKGTYDLSYIAVDETGNSARCDFQVHVLREFCKIPLPPTGGERECSDWGPGGRFKVCQIKCNQGLMFSQPIPKFYVCGAEGFWRPTEDPEKPLIFPSCAPKHSAQRIFRLVMTFPSSVVCSESGKKILNSRVIDSLLKIDRSWKICSDQTRGTCKGLGVNVKCTKQQSSSRSKRQSDNNSDNMDVYNVEIAFPANTDPIVNANSQEKDTLESIIRKAIVESAIFDVRDTLPNVMPDLTTLRLITEYACPPGQVVMSDSCVECSSGTYYDEPTSSCLKCAVGTYQNELGQLSCKKCPLIGDRQGVTITSGTRSAEDCRERCNAGKYFDSLLGSCRPCGYGLYQSSEGAFSCISCGTGLTTRSAEAVSQQECRPECMPGFQLSSNGNCEACPIGYYRTRGQQACEQCPSGVTTGTIGASSASQCNLEICSAGHYLNTTLDECVPCPKGTYQDIEQRDTSCQSCPPNSTTDGVGTASQELCSNPCIINDKMELCPPNSQCEAPNSGEDFRCVCKEGFKEVQSNELNYPHCVNICDDYCINGGRCEWTSGMKKPRCECLINFYGDRCERKSELIYIAGGIGAAVFFIIFIVLLIWMICVRTSSRPITKKMSVHTIPTDFASTPGPQPNFYYGAPAPYAESIAPSHHSTYAHYYDDEDDGWEMPNFYNETYMKESLHNGKSNGSTLQGISNPSLYGNKDDLYDRLRKHQYLGKKGDTTSDSEDQGN